jgi:hypothetical protein
LNRLNSFIILVQLLSTVFVVFAFWLTIQYSSVDSPGGSLMSVLARQPIFRLPISIIGGVSIVFALAALGLYAATKRKN